MTRTRIPALMAALALALGLAAVPQPSSGDVLASCYSWNGSKVSQPGPYRVGETAVVEIPSNIDGTTIQIGIVRPDVPEGHRSPVIVQASPYLLSDLRKVDLATCSRFLTENYVQHGYTVAFVPTRGAGGSDTCPNLMGPKERGDLDQAVTWLGTRPWSNGNVGMIGISYDGSTPWMVAAAGNPHLKTIVPASGVHNLFDLVYYRGRNDGRWWLFNPGYYYYYGLALNTPLQGRDPVRMARTATSCDDGDAGALATVESYHTGQYDSYGYWAERNMDPDVLERYRGSVLLVQGLQDWNVDPGHQYPFVNALEERGVYVKHLLGQWAHSWPDRAANPGGPRADFADVLLRWWDRWLKEDVDVDTGPRVDVQDSALQWRTEDSWPPKRATPRTLHLAADGTLAPAAGERTASTLLGPGTRNRYVYVNSNEQVYMDLPADRACAACATFTLDVKGQDLRLTGLPSLDLTLVPRGRRGHVAAFLLREDAGGRWHLLGWGASDLRFPYGGTTAQAFEPGRRMTMNLPLQPLDAVVPAGERLVLVLDQGHADHTPGVPFFPVELHYGAQLGAFHFDELPPASTG